MGYAALWLVLAALWLECGTVAAWLRSTEAECAALWLVLSALWNAAPWLKRAAPKLRGTVEWGTLHCGWNAAPWLRGTAAQMRCTEAP
jgi:hypothetical protein